MFLFQKYYFKKIGFIFLFFSPLFLFSQGVIVNAGFLILQPIAQVIITSNGNWTNNETSTYQNASTVEFISDLDIRFSVTTQPLNMEFLPQIAQIYADLKPPKVVYWRKLIKKDFILICDVCVIRGKYLFMNSLNRLSSYLYFRKD